MSYLYYQSSGSMKCLIVILAVGIILLAWFADELNND